MEAALRVSCTVSLQLWKAHAAVIHAVEGMLRSQLVQAIGSVVTAADFSKYME